MNLRRIFRHAFTTNLRAHRCFPTHALTAIEHEIHAAESRHSGELRFVV
jgi:hypothetical protein